MQGCIRHNLRAISKNPLRRVFYNLGRLYFPRFLGEGIENADLFLKWEYRPIAKEERI